jgi:hypothetical protein
MRGGPVQCARDVTRRLAYKMTTAVVGPLSLSLASA